MAPRPSSAAKAGPGVSGMGVGVFIEVDGRQVDRMMHAIEMTLMGTTLAEYLRTHMIPYMRRRAAIRFAREGDDVVGQWEPLAEVTNDIRDAQGFPREHPINRRTGQLESFILRGAFDQTTQANASSVFFPSRPTGKTASKLRVAQQGNPASPRVPPRPVVGANMNDMAFFINNFSFWFAASVQRGFRAGSA